ncbi:tripartite tricarboxylate transporter TctB family protein [Elongatibacter sediminis]|uniref:Tripartite tricarboxylate transporter TctB family protein n=1 Tax=Elongatibacter sediminis TaxID=3119006 RepID=A0AAW9RCE8_9GAMM
MRLLRPGTGLSIGFALLSAWFLWQSFGLSPVASSVPRVVLILTLVLLAVEALKSGIHVSGRADAALPDGGDASGPVPSNENAGPVGRCLAWIVLLPVALGVLGLLIGSTVYCLLFLRWRSHEPWAFSLATSCGLGLLLYLLYAVVFRAAPYAGLLGL